MRVLVTGGSGYFGSLLVRRLHELGHTVRVFDLNPLEGEINGVESIVGDIRDKRAVDRACADVEIVYHNVAQVPLARKRALFDSVNRIGTENVLRSTARHRARKLVYTSSSAVYGIPERNPVRESDIPVPRESYGCAKRAGELLCEAYAASGLDVTIIRPRTILGHGRLGIFQILFEWIASGTNVPVIGGGSNLYQFVHGDDLADACIRASRRVGATTYNCGTDRFGTMREALEELCAFAGTGSCVRSVPMTLATGLMKLTSALGLSPLGPYHSLMYGRSFYFDIEKARRELDWRPRYSNSEMFRESYSWYLAHRREILANSMRRSAHRSRASQGALALVRYLK